MMIDLEAIRRYIPDMLEARNRERNVCECSHRGPDSVSIDGDWLHIAGEKFAETVAEVERLQAEVRRERESYEVLQHDFEIHFKRAEDLDAPCHACHQLEEERADD